MTGSHHQPTREDGGGNDGADGRVVHRSWDTDESAVIAVVTCVAEVTGTVPERLRPLHDVIDPDALDRVVGTSPDVTVSFRYEGCGVTVQGNGQIRVAARDDGTW